MDFSDGDIDGSWRTFGIHRAALGCLCIAVQHPASLAKEKDARLAVVVLLHSSHWHPISASILPGSGRHKHVSTDNGADWHCL